MWYLVILAIIANLAISTTSALRHVPPVRARPVCTLKTRETALVQAGSLGLASIGFSRAAHAADRGRGNLNKSLVSLLRVRAFITSIGDDLASPEPAAERVTGIVKYILQSLDMKGSILAAAAYLPADRAETAQRHGVEAYEYMAQIVEFSGYDELRKPGPASRFGILSTPERVDFARKCLAAAGRELDIFLEAFNANGLPQARELYAQYFPPSV